MATSALDSGLQSHLFIWYGIICFGALILGAFLAKRLEAATLKDAVAARGAP